MSKHDTIEFVAGDDWEIRATLNEPDGTAMDLNGALFAWTLHDRYGSRVIEANEVTINITDAALGKLKVIVPSAVTTRLTSVIYYEALRVTRNGAACTPLMGDLRVDVDPMKVAA